MSGHGSDAAQAAASSEAAQGAAPLHHGFDVSVPMGGYAWWYLDAISDDGTQALTLITFIGSVFSPYYALARRLKGDAGADPFQHCAVNVALYGTKHNHWAMTERTSAVLKRTPTTFALGPSHLAWQRDPASATGHQLVAGADRQLVAGANHQLLAGTNHQLVINIDEQTLPWPTAPRPIRMRGQITVTMPPLEVGEAHALDAAGLHRWKPLAPCARVHVNMQQPAQQWQGHAYLDTNVGARPLERDFVRWDWSRARLADGRCVVLYDALRRGGSRLQLASVHDGSGAHVRLEPSTLSTHALATGQWGVRRATLADVTTAGQAAPRVIRSLEDGPFYARSLISGHWLGEAATAVHESLSCDRFASPWVQVLLPVRMPRRGS
jgi:carotenoid 1,2-hydratase